MNPLGTEEEDHKLICTPGSYTVEQIIDSSIPEKVTETSLMFLPKHSCCPWLLNLGHLMELQHRVRQLASHLSNFYDSLFFLM